MKPHPLTGIHAMTGRPLRRNSSHSCHRPLLAACCRICLNYQIWTGRRHSRVASSRRPTTIRIDGSVPIAWPFAERRLYVDCWRSAHCHDSGWPVSSMSVLAALGQLLQKPHDRRRLHCAYAIISCCEAAGAIPTPHARSRDARTHITRASAWTTSLKQR
jgi:hypothetical protein